MWWNNMDFLLVCLLFLHIVIFKKVCHHASRFPLCWHDEYEQILEQQVWQVYDRDILMIMISRWLRGIIFSLLASWALQGLGIWFLNPFSVRPKKTKLGLGLGVGALLISWCWCNHEDCSLPCTIHKHVYHTNVMSSCVVLLVMI